MVKWTLRWTYYHNNERFWRTMLVVLACLLLLQYTISMAVVTRRSRPLLGGGGSYGRDNCTGWASWADLWNVRGRVVGMLQWLGLVPIPAPPLPSCPGIPPNLTGPIPVTFQTPTLEEIESVHPELSAGGRWSPSHCRQPTKVAIIVPYRDREEHLRIWINNIHQFLQTQQLDYGIFIIEQDTESTFNRGLLLNIGFLEALKEDNYSCFIFHDVDLIPEDDRNIYTCSSQPRHMSASIDSLAYRLPYDTLFGGIEAFQKEQFQKVNGFSNKFFGWGGEDDDLYNRLKYHGLNITRYPMRISRYRMIRHLKRNPSPNRFLYLYSGKQRYDTDGLNSIFYKRLQLDRRKLFTLVSVQVNETGIISQGSESERDINLEMFSEIKEKMKNEKKETVEKIIAKIRNLHASNLGMLPVEGADIFLNKRIGEVEETALKAFPVEDETYRASSSRLLSKQIVVSPIKLRSQQTEQLDSPDLLNKAVYGRNKLGADVPNGYDGPSAKEDRHTSIQRLVDEQLSRVKLIPVTDPDGSPPENSDRNVLLSVRQIVDANSKPRRGGGDGGDSSLIRLRQMSKRKTYNDNN